MALRVCRCFPFLIFLLLMLLTSIPLVEGKTSTYAQLDVDAYTNLLHDINSTAIVEHIRYLSSLNSRLTGSPGYYNATNYIETHFRSYGLGTSLFHFNVTVPVDYGSTIKISNHPELILTIYPLEPNFVVPNTVENLTAPIVYVGEGDFDDLDGKNINCSIVLMDFNSHGNSPQRFGAEAVIYVEAEETTKDEIDQMRYSLPIYFPRFYMPRSDYSRLKSVLDSSDEPLTVTISSEQKWEVKTGINVLGRLEGKNPNITQIICSFYDSYSIVPSVAPGANDAAGIATLLELARVLPEYEPETTILFIALGGHYQGEAGSREFVEHYIFRDSWYPIYSNERVPVSEMDICINKVLNLALTARSHVWALCDTADMTGQVIAPMSPRMMGNPRLYDYIIKVSNALSKRTGKEYRILNAHIQSIGGAAGGTEAEAIAASIFARRTFCRGLIPLEHEHFGYNDLDQSYGLHGGVAVSFVTVDPMQYVCSPFDTFDKIDADRLYTQLETIIPTIFDLVTSDNFADYLKEIGEYSPPIANPFVLRSGSIITGVVAYYDKTAAWYTPMPNSLVVLQMESIGGVGRKWQTLQKIVVMTDGEGRFSVPQMMEGQMGARFVYNIYAFKLSESSGKIEYAPDFGMYRYTYTTPYLLYYFKNDVGFVTVFKCASAVAFDIVDPMTASSADIQRSIEVLDALADSPVESYGSMMGARGADDTAVIFVPADTRIKLNFKAAHLGRIPLGLLLNSKESNPYGVGYQFREGEQYVFVNAPLQFAKNLFYLVHSCTSELSQFGVNIQGGNVDDLRNDIRKVEEIFRNNEYSKGYIESLKIWSKSLNAYISTRNAKTDIISTIPYFSLMLILFAPVFQATVFPASGKKRIAAIAIIFAVFLIVLYALHPGFLLASNALMTVIGFLIIVLSAPSLGIVVSTLLKASKKAIRKLLGEHIIEVRRISAIGLSFSLGIENLKKRRSRTLIGLFTVTIVISSLIMFTSVTSIGLTRYSEFERKPTYTGIMIRQQEWLYPLDRDFVEAFSSAIRKEGLIPIPRAVLYTAEPTLGTPQYKVLYNIVKANKPKGPSVDIYTVVGMVPEQKIVEGVNSSLIDGRWFRREDRWACILNDYQARILDVSTSDKITFFGKNFTIVGIINYTIFDMSFDLNVQPLTAYDHRLPEQDFVHASSVETLIVDYETLFYFDPQIAVIAISVNNSAEALSLGLDLYEFFRRLEIWAGASNGTFLASASTALQIVGMQSQIILLVISSLLILNIMLASVHERKRDLHVMSTTGGSPTHIMTSFLSECVVYAILSGIFGYILATGVMKTLMAGSGLIVNFSSSWVLTAMGFAMLVMFFSVIYPMRIASKIVTPSLERAWRITTKPREDRWEIPLPFILASEEVDGVCRFVIEYLEGHKGERSIGFSVGAVSFVERKELDISTKNIIFNTHLTPYELGVRQDVVLTFSRSGGLDRWQILFTLNRRTGPRDVWQKNSPEFIDKLRKQLLLWGTLSSKEKQRYMKGSP